MRTVKYYLEKILEAFSSASYYEEVKEAKIEFFERAGQVAEGSEKFEVQMHAFLDWYLFDRPLKKEEIPPVKLFNMQKLEAYSDLDRDHFRALNKNVHSLFEVLKVKSSEIYLKDLFDKEKYIVDESDINGSFTKGDLFEGRLLPFGETLVFGDAFVFHPKESKSFISKQIKKIKFMDVKQKIKLVHRLSTMKLKAEQYPHISPANIYTEEPLF